MSGTHVRKSRLVSAGLLLVTCLTVTPAAAQVGDAAGYPKHTVKIVVGFAPGGTNDLLARLLGQKLSERLGQPFVVDNKPGANGIIAAEFGARAAPDGYTLLIAPGGTLAFNPATYAKLPYDALTSYEFLSNSVTYPLILSVRSDHPAKTVADLIAWGKANPDKANYASTSTLFQLTSELFNQRTGAGFVYIPFKSGGEMVTALLSGQVSMAFADTGPLLPHVKSGKIRPLATSGAQRLAELPDTPTLAEAGVPGIVVDGFSGLVAPKGTPAAIVKKLEGELIAIIKLPDVLERLSQLGQVPDGSTSAEFAARVAREIPLWTAVAKAANIKFD